MDLVRVCFAFVFGPGIMGCYSILYYCSTQTPWIPNGFRTCNLLCAYVSSQKHHAALGCLAVHRLGLLAVDGGVL